MTVTTENGIISINKEELESYRGISYFPFNCVLYLKTGKDIWIYETFEEVDNVFNF